MDVPALDSELGAILGGGEDGGLYEFALQGPKTSITRKIAAHDGASRRLLQ